MSIPRPGQPVRGSKSGAPIMALFDLLGRSWAMGIVWNLSDTARTFRSLQARCETISPTTLNRRLSELREAKIITVCDEGYCLTESGAELYTLLEPLGRWAKSWGRRLTEETAPPRDGTGGHRGRA